MKKETFYCLWCCELSIDPSGREVRCEKGFSPRFYRGEGIKRRCVSHSYDSEQDAHYRARLLRECGFRDFLYPHQHGIIVGI